MSSARADWPEEPHSPDVEERETLDGGFSAGLGFHFLPNETYWLDCHNHLQPGTLPQLFRMLDEWFGQLDAYRLGRVIAILREDSAFEACGALTRNDRRFNWIYWPPINEPDPGLLRQALDHGAVGLKLHNNTIMAGEADPGVWLTPQWENMFEIQQASGYPVLWHVTQRMSASPYHGGGVNSYWSSGREKRVKVTNEDLLRTFRTIVDRYPGIPFLGAHQLHVGVARLAELFDAHANVHVDGSCSMYLRWADTLYEQDRKKIRDFLLQFPDRVLFGTDSSLGVGRTDAYAAQCFLAHARFMLQLRLPDEVLQKIAHGNAERIFRLEPMSGARRGNARP